MKRTLSDAIKKKKKETNIKESSDKEFNLILKSIDSNFIGFNVIIKHKSEDKNFFFSSSFSSL